MVTSEPNAEKKLCFFPCLFLKYEKLVRLNYFVNDAQFVVPN